MKTALSHTEDPKDTGETRLRDTKQKAERRRAEMWDKYSETPEKKMKSREYEKGAKLKTEAINNDVTMKSELPQSKPKGKKTKAKKKKKGVSENEHGEEKETVDAKKLAMDYLEQWQMNREEWSFKKLRQVWLIKHMYDPSQVSDGHFSILLKYMEGMRGNAREVTQRQATDIMQKADDDNSEKNKDSNDSETDCEDKVKLSRARQVIQLLT